MRHQQSLLWQLHIQTSKNALHHTSNNMHRTHGCIYTKLLLRIDLHYFYHKFVCLFYVDGDNSYWLFYNVSNILNSVFLSSCTYVYITLVLWTSTPNKVILSYLILSNRIGAAVAITWYMESWLNASTLNVILQYKQYITE